MIFNCFFAIFAPQNKGNNEKTIYSADIMHADVRR